jgi:hypothetical protein
MFEPTSSDGGVSPSSEVDPAAVADTNDGIVTDTSTDELGEEDGEGNANPNPNPDDDSEEVDYEGKPFKAPKGVKEALLRHGDYTQKTQALAEERRAFEASRTASQANDKAYSEATVRVGVIDHQLKEYADVNWALLEQTDPVSAAQHWRIFSQLKDEKAQAEKTATDAKARIDSDAHSSRSKRAEEVRAQLPKLIPGFNAETDAKLANYGASQGYSKAEVVDAVLHNPVAALLLHKAMQWDDHVSKTTKAKAAAKQAAAQPAAEVASRGNAPANAEPKSTEQWMKWRNKQDAAKRGR